METNIDKFHNKKNNVGGDIVNGNKIVEAIITNNYPIFENKINEEVIIPIVREYNRTHYGAAIPFTQLTDEDKARFTDLVLSGTVYVAPNSELGNLMYDFYTKYFSICIQKDETFNSNDLDNSYYNLIDYAFNQINKLR